jgi:hypothetical protein
MKGRGIDKKSFTLLLISSTLKGTVAFKGGKNKHMNDRKVICDTVSGIIGA